jgi:hypothetical protein
VGGGGRIERDPNSFCAQGSSRLVTTGKTRWPSATAVRDLDDVSFAHALTYSLTDAGIEALLFAVLAGYLYYSMGVRVVPTFATYVKAAHMSVPMAAVCTSLRPFPLRPSYRSNSSWSTMASIRAFALLGCTAAVRMPPIRRDPAQRIE